MSIMKGQHRSPWAPTWQPHSESLEGIHRTWWSSYVLPSIPQCDSQCKVLAGKENKRLLWCKMMKSVHVPWTVWKFLICTDFKNFCTKRSLPPNSFFHTYFNIPFPKYFLSLRRLNMKIGESYVFSWVKAGLSPSGNKLGARQWI